MNRYFFLMITFSALLAVCGVVLKENRRLYTHIFFVNNYLGRVHLQIRKGYDPDVNKDKLVCDKVLLKGQKLVLKAKGTEILMYRKEINFNQDNVQHFTDWTLTNCEDSNCIIDNL
jgi:hypothetical protein